MREEYRETSSNPKETAKFISLKSHQQQEERNGRVYDWHCPFSVLSMKFSWAKPVVHSTETLHSSADTQPQDSWEGSSKHWASCTQYSLWITHISPSTTSSSCTHIFKRLREHRSLPSTKIGIMCQESKGKAWEPTSERAAAPWYRSNRTILFHFYNQYVKFSRFFC